MGLLDDAIREHLDLKRRRGADPSEVSRQEQEALGPPRRGEFATPGEARDSDADAEPPADMLDPEGVPEATSTPTAPAVDRGDLDVVAPPPEPPAVLGGEESDARDAWVEQPDVLPDPETVEPGNPGDAPAARAAGHEDVLEETPDFLQETPEHDRLWFEQRPPRDFDFDK
jgi:hypothetical protein